MKKIIGYIQIVIASALFSLASFCVFIDNLLLMFLCGMSVVTIAIVLGAWGMCNVRPGGARNALKNLTAFLGG
jgi:hypothetical protein